MRNQFLSFLAEFKKTLRLSFINVFTLLFQFILWPILTIYGVLMIFTPFGNQNIIYETLSFTLGLKLGIFIIIGYLITNMFIMLLYGSSSYSIERQYGTLELIFLSPVNRLAVIAGNAFGTFFIEFISFIFFLIFFLIYFCQPIENIPLFAIAIIFIIFSATSFGLFMNSLFIISRNDRFIYALFSTPLDFFSGTKFAISLLPKFLYMIGLSLPLVHNINLLRWSLAINISLMAVIKEIVFSLSISFMLIGFSAVIMHFAEKRFRKTGSLVLF